MNSKRLHHILVASITLLFIGLAAGAYGINSLLGSEANKLTTLKAKSLALAQEQISLNKAKKDVKKYAELEKIAHAVVPEDKNQAEAVREIVNIAAANDVKLAAINFPASNLGNSAVASAAATTTAAPVAPVTKGSGLSQLQAVKNISGVYQLVITINSDSNQTVPYNKFINFLSDLEHNRRTAQVSTITLQPDPKNHNNLTFTLGLSEYIKP